MSGHRRRSRARRGLLPSLAVLGVTVAVGSLSLAYILAKQGTTWPWQERIAYQADFAEAPAVLAGRAEVRIAGVMVGTVSKAVVTDDGHARLSLSLRPQYATVYENARVILHSKSPLNDMYVSLQPGSPPARALPPDSVIPMAQTVRPIQGDEVLAHLDERTREALGSLVVELDATLAQPESLPAALHAATGTLTSLRPVAEELAGRRAEVARLVTALADIATAVGADDTRLKTLVANARGALETLAARDADLDATLGRLPGVADDLRHTLGQLDGVADELNPVLDGVRSVAGALPDTLREVQGTVEALGGAVDRLGPIVSAAGPVVRDLRPIVAAARSALGNIATWSPRLDPMTANLVRYLPWLSQALYQTSSALQLEDANGPTIRAHILNGPQGLPREVRP